MKKLLLLLAIFSSFAAKSITYFSDMGYYQATMVSDCTPATVSFNTFSTPVGTFSKQINFDDGTALTAYPGASINHVYPTAGEYDVFVLYFDSGGGNLGYDYCRIEIYGQPGPVVNVYGATNSCPGDKVRMEVSQGFNPPVDFSYSWDWGDGSPLEVSSQNDLQHIYATPGLYTITVTTTAGTCGGGPYTSVGNMNISTGVGLPPYLSYDVYVNPKTVCPGDQVYAAYPEEFASVFGNWGDGTIATSGHTHAYTGVGDYYPQITITNGCGFSQTFKDTVHVVNTLAWSSSTPAGIGYNTNTVCPGSEINLNSFQNAAEFAWYDHSWNLIGTDDYIKLEFDYTDSVYLTLTNGCGFDTTVSATIYVVTNIPVDPDNFDVYASDSACTGAMFAYASDNNEYEPGMSYSWDFGDGTVETNYGGTHAYASPGTYSIIITATNSCGMDTTATLSVYVGAGVAPDANSLFYFVPEDAEICVGDSALFAGLYYISDGTYLIDYGDGQTSTTPSTLTVFGQTYLFFTHAYSALGLYNTSLKYTNSCGLSVTKYLTVSVGSNYPADANAFYNESSTICLGDPISFYGFGGNQFIWDFGDGSGYLITDEPMNPVDHIYENPGSYTVYVQITNGCGNSNLADINIIVPDNRIYITTNTIDAQCHQSDGKAIAVITGGNSPYNVSWSNGSTSILVDSLTSGIYVCNVTDQNGCYNFGIATVSDAQAPAIIVNTIQDVTCNGGNDGVIDINVIGSSAPYSYSWSNGSSSEDQAGLVAGPYEVYVTDANGCIATASISVDQPDEVLVSFIVSNATCGGTDGAAIATANGNSGPFIYVWNTGATGPDLNSVGLGIYEVNVIDSKGCIVTESISVNEDNGSGGPAIALNSISNLDCGGAGSTIDISVYASTGANTFTWSNSATTEDITVTTEGIYTVTVLDNGSGCRAMEQYTIDHAAPTALNICMVSVDSMYAANKIIFEKPVSTTIDHFNIYRESSMAGLYYNVGSVPYDSLSIYTDVVANPQIQSWRYKISVVDDCGAESSLSDEHKTIHLNQNLGLIPGSVNLIWDDYEGFDFTTFNVLRYTASTGYVSIASLSALNFSYTDLSAPLSDSTLFYIVTIDLGTACVSTRAQNNNTVRSNRSDNALAPPVGGSISDAVANIAYSHVYPNPSNDLVTVEFEVTQSADYTIQIIDAIGNSVLTQSCGKVDVFCKKQIDLNNIENGVYFVNIQSKDGRISKRLIKM